MLRWQGRELYVGRIYIGEVHQLRPWSSQWRAWLMVNGDGGDEVSRHDVSAEACVALEIAAREALSPGVWSQDDIDAANKAGAERASKIQWK